MSWQELNEAEAKLREQLSEVDKRGETQYDKNDVLQMWPPQHLLENPDPLDMKYIADSMSEAIKAKEAKQPGEKQDAPKSPPKGYPESKDDYADPTNYKYPLDTEKHVRAAMGYLSQADNAAKYGPEERKFMWRRIITAAKKYGIELSDEVKKQAEMVGPPDEGGDKSMDDKQVEQKLAELVKQRFEDAFKTAGNPQADAMKKMSDEMEAFKAKHAEMEKRMEAFDGLLKEAKAKFGEFEKKLGASEKLAEQKLKEMAANLNAGTLLATLEQAVKGANPSGLATEEGVPVGKDDRNLTEIMDDMKNRPRSK